MLLQQHADGIVAIEERIQSLSEGIVDDINFKVRLELVRCERMEALHGATCETCGNLKNSSVLVGFERQENEIKKAQAENDNKKIAVANGYEELRRFCAPKSYILSNIEREKNKENNHLARIEELKAEINSYIGFSQACQDQLKDLEEQIPRTAEDIEYLQTELADLDLILEVSAAFRAALVKSTIQGLEINTNKLLTDYFDAEIRVKFDIEDADKIDVTIYKDGNTCSYTQLSKGQRQLLKLAFGVSVMKSIANHHGIKFNSIFFDEVMTGLDTNMAVRAFSLLNSLKLEYDNIYVIDHNDEIKALAEQKIEVRLVDGVSTINE
jgi:DNA repair exonuclease SbcCD ATPase subunit